MTSTRTLTRKHTRNLGFFTQSQFRLQTNTQMAATETTKADDGEALQSLFANYCDQDGLMTKETLATQISAIRELLVRVFYCMVFLCCSVVLNVCIYL